MPVIFLKLFPYTKKVLDTPTAQKHGETKNKHNWWIIICYNNKHLDNISLIE